MKKSFKIYVTVSLLISLLVACGKESQSTSVVAVGSIEAASDLTWETDFEAASLQAKKAGKQMLLNFTGSDWCGWCIRLDKEVFSQAEFKAYAKDALILVELDFPRGKELDASTKAQNEALAQKYEIRGFPTILILSPEGELVGKTGYQRGGAAEYVEHLKELIGQ
jgi:protein disulfide-isomerase